MFFAGIVLMIKNPELLKKRLNTKEKLDEQGVVIKLSGLMFVTGFVVAGLGHRCYLYEIHFEVFKEHNRFPKSTG